MDGQNKENLGSGPIHTVLRQFLAVFGFFQLIWLGHLIPYVVPSSQEVWIEAVKWYPIYIPLAILVYWLSINSFLRHIEGKSVC